MKDYFTLHHGATAQMREPERQKLLSQYLAWRNSGGVPTVITKETLRQQGMRRAGRWGAHLSEKLHLSSFVVGERQAPNLDLVRGVG